MSEFCTLDLKRHLDKKANYHTHTTRCKHANGTEREYIEKAIEAGYQVLGFSDHSPYICLISFIYVIYFSLHSKQLS